MRARSPPPMPRINFFQTKAEFTPKATASPDAFRVGGRVEHTKFGVGQVLAIDGQGVQRVARIAFPGGEKKLFLSFAPLPMRAPEKTMQFSMLPSIIQLSATRLFTDTASSP